MIVEIKHYLQECRNAIFAFIVLFPLQILILTLVNSTIQIQTGLYIIGIIVVLSFGFLIGMLLLRCFIDKRHFKNKVVILFSLLFATIFSVLFTTLLAVCTVLLLDIKLNTLLNQIETLAISFILLITIEFVIDLIISFRGYRYINKIAMCKNVANYGSGDNEYSAVLIGNNLSWDKNIITNVGACGLYFLIEYFKNTNKHYIICQKVGKSHFDKFVLEDDKCQELYLLGHGSKRNFSINNENDEKIYYSEYKDAPKKRVIAQLHCAHTVIRENNESLVDLLATDEEKSYVGNGYIFFFNEWWYYLNIWANNMQIPPTSILKRHLFYTIKCIQK